MSHESKNYIIESSFLPPHFRPSEIAGNPPNVAVPTHFAKVVFATGGKYDAGGKGAIGSFVLPNDKISNEQPLTSFEVPVESVERSAGLTLLPESVKTNPVRLCSTVQCDSIMKTRTYSFACFSYRVV
jgi:endonuclease G